MKSRLLQILFIIIHHPTERHSFPFSTPPNPAPCQNIHTHHNAEQRRGQEGKSARRADGLRNSECFPFSRTCPRQSVPSKGKKPTHSSSQQQKKVPANKDATTALSYREELHRPEAPQGRTRPLSVTGSPISCDSTLPFQGFSSVASI